VARTNRGQFRQTDIFELFCSHKVPVCRIAGTDPDVRWISNLATCYPDLNGRVRPEPDLANRISVKNLREALILAVLFSAITAIAGLLHGIPSLDSTLKEVLLGTGSFGCLGFLLGGIYAFDPESKIRIKSSSIGRMFFGLLASLPLAALWQWPREAIGLAALVGVVLGYFGMTWTRYINF
jgi:hypothetical protein